MQIERNIEMKVKRERTEEEKGKFQTEKGNITIVKDNSKGKKKEHEPRKETKRQL